MKTLKLLSAILLVAIILSTLASCSLIGGDTSNYPEGSIALNKYTVSLYYDISTYATCEYHPEGDYTEAIAYVIVKPRFKMRDAAGKLVVSIDTRVTRSFGLGDFKISNMDETILLKPGEVNKSYKLTMQKDGAASDPWQINHSSVGISIVDASGYVLIDLGN